MPLNKETKPIQILLVITSFNPSLNLLLNLDVFISQYFTLVDIFNTNQYLRFIGLFAIKLFS